MNKSLLLAFLSIMFCLAVQGQEQDSLYQYLVIAAKNNPVVLQRYSEYQAALQKVPQAGGLPDPELTFGIFIQPMELVAGNQYADIKLMQMFPWFGTLRSAKDEMSLMAKAKFEAFRDAKLQVMFDVQRAWYELMKLQSDISLIKQNIGILHTVGRLTLVKYKVAPSGPSEEGTGGGAGLADLYRIQIEIGDLDNSLALLQDQVTTETARFNSYLNRPPAYPVLLADKFVPDSLTSSLGSVTDSILANNPTLNMLVYEQKSLEARKQMVTRMGYPMLGLGLDYSIIGKSDMSTSSMNGRDMVMPMATLTLPVYRNKYNAMRSEADLMQTASHQSYQATANSLQTEYFEASQLLKDGQRRIKLYERQSYLAQRTLDIMLTGFTTDANSLTDILRVRQQCLEYDMKKIEAIADYNTAISWLKRLMASSTVKEK